MIEIYQIYYDELTKDKVCSGFIPLDNTKNLRPDWYEFWPILNFLRNKQLDDDVWYGFVSPKFENKSGFKSSSVIKILTTYSRVADVALFSPAWDQIAYFSNQFEQGEYWHPGLMQASQDFLDAINYKLDLKNLITYSSTSVFSNYVIAKPRFWRAWLSLAEKFWDYVENLADEENTIRRDTIYGELAHTAPLKTFVQERLASLILSSGNFKVLAPDQSLEGVIWDVLFNNDARTRRSLQTCDLLKEKYIHTEDQEYLSMYKKIRSGIALKIPEDKKSS